MSKRGKAHLCLTCRHASWKRCAGGPLSSDGYCDAPDPALPALPAVKCWNTGAPCGIRGGDIYRKPEFPVEACDFYQRGKTT